MHVALASSLFRQRAPPETHLGSQRPWSSQKRKKKTAEQPTQPWVHIKLILEYLQQVLQCNDGCLDTQADRRIGLDLE